MEKIYFAKLNENAKIPSKRDEDAGYDIFACFDDDYLVINPNQTIKINTKIASAFSKKYCIILKERGSTGVIGFGQRAGVIDSGYRNEWLVPMTNHNDIPIIIVKDEFKSTQKYLDMKNDNNFIEYSYNKAICQGLLIEVPVVEVSEVSYEELLEQKSDRMLEGFGSTNK